MSPSVPRRPLAFVWLYVSRRPWLFGGLLGLVVGAASCAVAVQYGMKLLVDAMADPGRADLVWTPLALFIGLIALESLLWRLAGYTGCRGIVGAGVDIRLDLYRHLSGHALGFFTDHLSGALAHRITATAGAFGAVLSTLTWNILPPCTDFLGALLVFSTVDPWMALALTGFVAVVGGGITLYGERGRPLHRHYAEQANQVGGELVDVVSNIWVVKTFGARAREGRRLTAVFETEAAAQRHSWFYLEKTRLLHDTLLWVMAGGMLIWAVQLWAAGRITPGDVVVVSALTFRILHGSRDLAFAVVGLTQHFGIIAETLGLIGRSHAIVDPPEARPLINLGGSIEFQDVSFSYPDGRQVFRDFSLRIPAAQRLGIVGPSGAGKSTLVGLVYRIADVQGGRILIDEQAVASVTQDSLLASVAVVPQEISLFHRSVLENIRYGRPEADDDEVVAAARAARCDGFIRELPEGYRTVVGERGLKLSGGQRQRIGIARALLKNAPIILLDEATSALDTESEMEIQQALNELMKGRTVLAVAHRLSTVAGFDRIVVLVEGRIVEDGSPAELRRQSGPFAALCRLQAQGFSVDDVMSGGWAPDR